MKKNKLNLLILVIITLLSSSCSFKVLNFSMLSSKQVDLSKAATFVKGKNKVVGKDIVHIIVIISTRTVKINKAVDRAIENTPGCVALLDGVIYTKFWWIPYIYGKSYAIVEGIPLIDPSLVYTSSKIQSYGKIELNTKGEIKSVESISDKEFYAFKNKIVKENLK